MNNCFIYYIHFSYCTQQPGHLAKSMYSKLNHWGPYAIYPLLNTLSWRMHFTALSMKKCSSFSDLMSVTISVKMVHLPSSSPASVNQCRQYMATVNLEIFVSKIFVKMIFNAFNFCHLKNWQNFLKFFVSFNFIDPIIDKNFLTMKISRFMVLLAVKWVS